MSIHQRYNLSNIINAAGTYTPLGVSRSSSNVASISAEALMQFFDMDELQGAASSVIADWSGAEAGTVTHCVSSAIVLSIAAAMTRHQPEAVDCLPDSSGLPNKVVLPAGHAVNYGHPIVQDIRLAGATPVLAGTVAGCSLSDLECQLGLNDVACLLLVSSRLVQGEFPDLKLAVAAAHAKNKPVIIDAAAQDMRVGALLETGADMVLLSAHKYLASPTAGLAIGEREWVKRFRLHEKGIGRSMKASKEAIVGVLAAISERQEMDLDDWKTEQQEKVDGFIRSVGKIAGISAAPQPDPAGMPFARVVLSVMPEKTGLDTHQIADKLAEGDPSIRVMRHALDNNQIILELVPLTKKELDVIAMRLATILLE